MRILTISNSSENNCRSLPDEPLVIAAHHGDIDIVIPGNKAMVPYGTQCRPRPHNIGDIRNFRRTRSELPKQFRRQLLYLFELLGIIVLLERHSCLLAPISLAKQTLILYAFFDQCLALRRTTETNHKHRHEEDRGSQADGKLSKHTRAVAFQRPLWQNTSCFRINHAIAFDPTHQPHSHGIFQSMRWSPSRLNQLDSNCRPTDSWPWHPKWRGDTS